MASESAYLAPGVPNNVSDSVVQEYIVSVPLGGLLEGQDPASITYPESYAPTLENIRVSQALWSTRLGQVLTYQIGGSGDVRFLDALQQSGGTFTWLAARGTGTGAQLYELIVGTDTGFVAASGGANLGGTASPYFQGTTLGDAYYLTDRQNTLYKYLPAPSSGNHLQSLSLPTAPAVAATVVPRPFTVLENYNTAWTDSAAAHFDQTVDTSANPPPDGSVSSKFQSIDTGSVGNTATSGDFVWPSVVANYGGGISHSIAFWTKHDTGANTGSVGVQIQYGSNTATDYSVSLKSDQENVNTWYPFFIPIGDMSNIAFLRALCQSAAGGGAGSIWTSTMVLPGTLEGPYRWTYTYYDSTGGRESAPAPITNNGQPVDFSVTGVSFDMSTTGAFNKSALLLPTLSGDSSVNKIRIYRNGGVPSLTTDANGLDLWLWVADIPNFSTTLNGATVAGNTSAVLNSVTGLSVGDWLVFDPGVSGKQEALQVSAINTGTKTVTLTNGLNYGTSANAPESFAFAHGNAATVRACYVDNTPNESINLLQNLDVPIVTGESTRTAPPAGALYVQRSPEGRLWLFNTSGNPTGVAVSNRATPFRPTDYQTFTSGVDPLTRSSLTMGWNFQIFENLAQDEAIEWGGFFRGWATILTRNSLYVVTAHSQSEWGPTSVQRLHSVGCLPGAGDTVREVDGVLYWVAPGPKVMAWDGAGPPQNISHHRVNVRLSAASAGQWNLWFAQTHNRQDGRYYMLYFVPSGQTQPTQRLDYNIDLDAWEPCVYYGMNSVPIGFRAGLVVNTPSTDPDGFYQVDTNGNLWQAETGNLDGGLPIQITFSTPKIQLAKTHPYWVRFISDCWVHSLLIRMAAANDTVTVTATTGSGALPPLSHSYPVNLLNTGAGIQNPLPAAVAGQDTEIKQRLDRDLFGRYLQLSFTGSVSNRPQFRTLSFFYLPIRDARAWG